jgi:hypothetical protein
MPTSTIEIVAYPVDRHGHFAVYFVGTTICHRTRQPLLDAARRLLGLAHPPEAVLILWRDGVASLRSRLGNAAGLTVEESRWPQAGQLRAELIGADQCVALGITVRGYAPALKICRQFIAAGFDLSCPLHCYRGTVLALARALRKAVQASRGGAS